jgi:DNA mismatch endonuclease (patch repair protein)
MSSGRKTQSQRRSNLVMPRLRATVFVDGCYGHACPERIVPPKSSAAWCAKKVAANVAGNRFNDAELIEIGGEPFRVWEHGNPEVAAEHLTAQWRAGATVSGSSGAH